MESPQKELAVRVLKAIEEGWSLVDDHPEDDFMLLVNESRDEKKDLFPKKELVAELENEGLIIDPEKTTQSAQHEIGTYYKKEGSDGDWIAVSVLDPIVYQYEITDKGRVLLNTSDR